MTVAQVAGGSLGAVLGGILAQCLQTYLHYSIDVPTATAIVVAMIGAVGWVAHGVDVYGLAGVLGRIWHGKPQAKA